MEKLTSKGKKIKAENQLHVKTVYCHPAYLTYMQGTS